MKSRAIGCSAGIASYYDDHGDALRFEKSLGAEPRRRSTVAVESA